MSDWADPTWATLTDFALLRAEIEYQADADQSWVLDMGALNKLRFTALTTLHGRVMSRPTKKDSSKR